MWLRIYILIYLWTYICGFHLSVMSSGKKRVIFAMQSEESASITTSCPMASKCSGAYRSKGCDGNGKIQGGIATVPLFSWWPIKVYRPCPSYLEAGYQYRREGQTMEQVLFSEPSNKMKEKLAASRKQELDMEKLKKKEAAQKERNLDEVDAMIQEKFGKKDD